MSVEALTSELIRFRTEAPAGDEERCALFLRDYIQDMGLADVEFEVHNISQNRANLIVRIGGGVPPRLLFSGHMDTVAAGDLKLWTVTHPCEPKSIDGRLYGRGAADMKGGLAAMVESLKVLKGSRLRHGITLVATAGEESGCYGLRKLIEDHKLDGTSATYAVVSEPTEMKVVRRHKGVTRFHVHFIGRSAHSSQPVMGVNAIENASEFISELRDYRAKIALESDSELGVTILPVTFVEGGIRGRFNVIPERCELVIVCRRLPRHSSAYLRDGLQSILQELGHRLGPEQFDARVEVQYEANSLDTSRDSPIVAIGERLTGSDSTFAPFGTEAAFYQDMGIPSIVLGPGSVAQAHVPDEFVRVEQLEEAGSLFRSMIREICL